MKRHLLLLTARLALAFGIVSAMAFPWITEPPLRFTEEDWHLTYHGMTEDEVVAALGCAPGDYRLDPGLPLDGHLAWFEKGDRTRVPQGWTVKTWVGDGGGLIICFDENHRLQAHGFHEYYHLSLRDRVRRRFGW